MSKEFFSKLIDNEIEGIELSPEDMKEFESLISESTDNFLRRVKKDKEAEKNRLFEFFSSGKIKVTGDYAIINGKRVGKITNNTPSGFTVHLEDGSKKEFDTVEELYSFIASKYNIKESLNDVNPIFYKKLQEFLEVTEEVKVVLESQRDQNNYFASLAAVACAAASADVKAGSYDQLVYAAKKFMRGPAK